MASFRGASWSSLWPVAIVLAIPSLATSASLDSLMLRPIGVRLVAPRTSGGCWGDFAGPTFLERMKQAVDSTRMLRLDSTSTALLRLRLDSADGICDLSMDFQDTTGRASAKTTLQPGQRVDGSDALERLVSQISRTLLQERGAEMEISTTPPGASVVLGGLEAGSTPLRLEGIAAGSLALELTLADWEASRETLSVQPGRKLSIERALTRTRAWLDSVARAEAAHRRDSIWNQARTLPAKDLAELFDRIALPVVPGSRLPVAIAPFDVQGARDGGYDPGVMAAEYGVARWSGDPRFQVVERTSMSKLLAEQAFAQSGAASDSDAARMGLLAAAKYLVTGTVQVADGKQVFTARMVSVETGEIVSAGVCEKTSPDLEAMYREALGEKGQMSATLYRSMVGPGWGQFYTGHPVHGGIALGSALASIGFAAWAYMDYADKDDQLQKFRKHDPATVREGESLEEWIDRAEAARDEKNKAGTMLGISFGVVGAVWVANVVDAAILGRIESRRIKARYFAYFPTPMAGPEGLSLAWRF